MIFGIPWCAITSIVAGAFLNSLWFSEANDPITINGSKTTMDALSIWIKLGMSAFFVPFIAIGIATLFGNGSA